MYHDKTKAVHLCTPVIQIPPLHKGYLFLINIGLSFRRKEYPLQKYRKLLFNASTNPFHLLSHSRWSISFSCIIQQDLFLDNFCFILKILQIVRHLKKQYSLFFQIPLHASLIQRYLLNAIPLNYYLKNKAKVLS